MFCSPTLKSDSILLEKAWPYWIGNNCLKWRRTTKFPNDAKHCDRI